MAEQEPIGEKLARLDEKMNGLMLRIDDIAKDRMKAIEERLVALERYRYILIGVIVAGEVALKTFWK